jgi:hypothetical protein
MSVHLPLLALGILLLCFPRQWMRFGRAFGPRKRRHGGVEPWKTREPGDPRLSYGEFAKVRNYFDLVRAAAGALAIVGSPLIEPAIMVAHPANPGALRQILLVDLAILGVGVLIQTVRYERRHISFYPPVFFLAGISVGLCGPWAALFAFVLVWAVNAMFGNAEAFLTVYGFALLLFGLLFRDTARLFNLAALAFALLPVLLALLTRRPLVVLARKPVSAPSS